MTFSIEITDGVGYVHTELSPFQWRYGDPFDDSWRTYQLGQHCQQFGGYYQTRSTYRFDDLRGMLRALKLWMTDERWGWLRVELGFKYRELGLKPPIRKVGAL